MSKATLWLVEIDEADWDYDNFVEATVWAADAAEAEAIVRAAVRHPALTYGTFPKEDQLWIEKPEWRLHVKPAPTEGVVLVHWHAG